MEEEKLCDYCGYALPNHEGACIYISPKSILRLTIKKKWFDMIANGEKKEEYRKLKDHWFDRLTENDYPLRAKHFDYVEFRNGYTKDAPALLVECKGIMIGDAKPEWSDNSKGGYFIISLGKIVADNKVSNKVNL